MVRQGVREYGRTHRSKRCQNLGFNVVTPEEVIDAYGADALRLYELFIGPLSVSAPWQTRGVEGVYRFLQRVWRLAIDEDTGEPSSKLTDAPVDSDPELWKVINQTIKDVTEDTESIDKMNTAISHMMVFRQCGDTGDNSAERNDENVPAAACALCAAHRRRDLGAVR